MLEEEYVLLVSLKRINITWTTKEIKNIRQLLTTKDKKILKKKGNEIISLDSASKKNIYML